MTICESCVCILASNIHWNIQLRKYKTVEQAGYRGIIYDMAFFFTSIVNLSLFTALAMAALTPSITSNQSVTVSSGNDVAYENNGVVALSPNYLYLGRKGNYLIGIRFRDIQIPPGTTIKSAFITFTARVKRSVALSVKVRTQQQGDFNAPEFQKQPGYISSLPTSAAEVNWTVPVWNRGAQYNTVDLSTIVQEVVHQSTWSSGNAMVFIFERGGGATIGAHRVAYGKSFDWAEPKLTINY